MAVSKYSAIKNVVLFGFVGTGMISGSSADMLNPTTFSSLSTSQGRDALLSKNHIKVENEVNQSAHRLKIKYATRLDTFPTIELNTQQRLHSLRSGGIVQRNSQTLPSNNSFQQTSGKNKKKALLFLTSVVAFYGVFHTRSTWLGFFNKEKLQASVVESLENLNEFPYLYSRTLYTISMAVWETLGMSTIPVETAAGMVFGWSAFYWSAIGKLLGACLAFGLGRGALSSVVEKKFSSNEFLNLIQSSAGDNPLLVVILIKLSAFPETVKNFGSSILKPIRWWMFVLASGVHGLTFTALWTYLGVDTAARLKDTEGLLLPDQRLKALLTLALINGIVVSPLSMFYWIRSLKHKQNSTKSRKKSK